MACLFVYMILADLAFDQGCDLPPTVAGASTFHRASSAPGTEDPCARGCVPDCFCCSQGVTRGPAVLPPDAGPVSLTIPLRLAGRLAGVRPVPYRPPLNLA